MRIATWNLERGGTRAAEAAQRETLSEIGADVVVLTEPPVSYRAGPGVITSPPLRSGPHGLDSWIAIAGESVEPVSTEIPYERVAVAARVVKPDHNVIVYGAVLPWLSVRSHAPYLARDGETFSDVFARVLAAQKADLERLRSECDILVWAGDFNQSVVGSNQGGSTKGREAMIQCLSELGLAAWNGHANHAREGLCAIDLICGPEEQTILAQGRIDPERDGVRMSDHAGYWVDI